MRFLPRLCEFCANDFIFRSSAMLFGRCSNGRPSSLLPMGKRIPSSRFHRGGEVHILRNPVALDTWIGGLEAGTHPPGTWWQEGYAQGVVPQPYHNP